MCDPYIGRLGVLELRGSPMCGSRLATDPKSCRSAQAEGDEMKYEIRLDDFIMQHRYLYGKWTNHRATRTRDRE